MISLSYCYNALFVGTPRIIRFYVKYLLYPFFVLPEELQDFVALKERAGKKKAFKVAAPQTFVSSYNRDYQVLHDDINNVHKADRIPSFASRATTFFLIKLLCAFAAMMGSIHWTIGLSLLQFVFLPYSFPVAVIYGIQHILTLHIGSIVAFPAIEWTVNSLVPEYIVTALSITISPMFIICFLLVDQLLCVLLLFWNPMGKPKFPPIKRLMQSFVWGFLNCKSYFLILLPLCLGVRINLIAWVIDAVFGISAYVDLHLAFKRMEVTFYHVHRIGHLPFVYADSHKFHHYIHDTTPFDAHIFGSGAPEDWVALTNDILRASAGMVPSTFLPAVLKISWFNKFNYHSRVEADPFDEDNFHADHHAIPNVNFGAAYPFELLFGTVPAARKTEATFSGHRVTRVESEYNVTLKFSPLSEEGEKSE